MSSDAICPLPFFQLFLNPNGTVTPCCYLSQQEPASYDVGDIRVQTLEEMWNGEPMRALRRSFLSGDPKICRKYIDRHQCNRIHAPSLAHVELNESLPFPMRKLDLMLNGKCNLECVMCGVWTQPNQVYTENGFWEEGAAKIFPYLKVIDAKGGEPFIQKEIYRLIDEVSRVNPACQWLFTTNGQYRFNDRIASYASKIMISHLSVSIDSLDPENFARIRLKGRLAQTLESLDRWIAFSKFSRATNPVQGRSGFEVNVNMCVQQANWKEVPRMYEFCARKGIPPFFTLLTQPARLSLFDLPVEEKIQVLEFYLSAAKEHQDDVYSRLIRPLAASLPGPVNLKGLESARRGRSIAAVDY
ncbi:MAG TPA: SPASM domain-containing protein [Bdellovibrionota bacterium]|nr:SPASM domain-containing protein [Bdellovibrionota bacterium]